MSLFRRRDLALPAPPSDTALERYAYAIGRLAEFGWPNKTAAQLARPAAHDEPGTLLVFNEGNTSFTQYLTDPLDIECAHWCGTFNLAIAIP